MRKSLFALSCAVSIVPISALAQSTSPAPAAPFAPVAQPATVLPAVAAPTQAVLRAQTPVVLRMAEELTTKKKAVRVGQRFNLEVAEPVTVGGVTVIPAGSPATGEITQVRNKGMWGKSGYIGARLVQVRVGDRTIRLAGSFDDKGVTGTGGVVAAIAFLPIAGFVTTGTSAVIPMGSNVKGFIDEDVPLALQVAAPMPLPVAAPTAPAVVPAPAAGLTTVATPPEMK